MPGADRRRRRDAAPAASSAPAPVSAPDWDAVRDELGATAPGAFVEARERKAAEARAAGDPDLARRIHALRRPTLSAWASNLLVRGSRKEVASFLQLGASMRRAQQELDAAQLRELSRRRWRVISLLSQQAAERAAEAGHTLSETVRREVESTLRAVLADPDAAEQWAAGHLDKPLQAPMQLTPSAAPDRAAAGRAGRHRKEREREAARAAEHKRGAQREREASRAAQREREAARAAERELREARKRQMAARTAHAAASADLDRARSDVDDLRARLTAAEDTLARATATARSTADALTEADTALARLT